MGHIVAEKTVGIAGFIGIYADRITVVAVQSHTGGNPNDPISVGIKTVCRDLGKAFIGRKMVEFDVLRLEQTRKKGENQ